MVGMFLLVVFTEHNEKVLSRRKIKADNPAWFLTNFPKDNKE